MDNTAPVTPPVNNTVPQAPNIPPASNKNSWIKYLTAEAAVIFVVIGVIVLVIFKPFGFLKPKYKVPADMNRSVLPNGKVVVATPPAFSPSAVVVHLTESGFEPKTASFSGSVVLSFQNNSQAPANIEFSGPSKVDPETIDPFQGSPTRYLNTKGTYKFFLKDAPDKAGEIIIN